MAFPRNNNGSSNITSSQNPSLIPTPQMSNVYTNLHLPISNRYSYVNNPLVHTQRAQYQPSLAGVVNRPGVRPGQQNMHVLQTSSLINANAYRGVSVLSTVTFQPRPLTHFPGNIIVNNTFILPEIFNGRGLPQHLGRGTQIPSTPIQVPSTHPLFPYNTVNQNPLTFQPPILSNPPSLSLTNHRLNTSRNSIVSRTSTRFRLPSLISSNINIGRSTFTSNQAQVQPTTTRATSPTTSNFVPTPVFPRFPHNSQARPVSSGPSHVVRENNTATTASAPTTTTTTASHPRPRPQPQPQPHREHTCSECDKTFATGSALGGHMSSHARKRKLEEEATSGKRFKPVGYRSFLPLDNGQAFESGSFSCSRANPITVSASGPSDPSTSRRSENVGVEGTEAPSIKREQEEDEKGPS